MAAGTYNILVEQGSTFSQSVTVKEDGSPRDLTGYSARAHLRPTRTSTTLTATFTCTISNPSTGVILMELAPSTTAGIADGRYYYDLEIYTSGDAIVSRLLQGEVTVSPEVTR